MFPFSLSTMWLAMLGTSLGRFFPQLTHPLPTGSHISIPVPWQDTLRVSLQTDRDVDCTGIWWWWWLQGWGWVLSLSFGSFLRLGSACPASGKHNNWCPVCPMSHGNLSVKESTLSNCAGGNLNRPWVSPRERRHVS